MAAFPGIDWYVVGDGRVWPYPDQSANHHQTWLREPATGRYHIDVFREPHIGGLWVCRRDASITLPYGELILRTSEGIPYATPEVALLFKAKQVREKDEADFQRVLPMMNPDTAITTDQLAIPSPPRPPVDHTTRSPRALTLLS